jgi:hypothetical protein
LQCDRHGNAKRVGGLEGVGIATLIFRYFSSTSTEQISPDSAGPFNFQILLALLFRYALRNRIGCLLQAPDQMSASGGSGRASAKEGFGF